MNIKELAVEVLQLFALDENYSARTAKDLAQAVLSAEQTTVDPDMPAQQLRMHLGEMTAQEMRTARAAIRWANSARGQITGEGLREVEEFLKDAVKCYGIQWQGGFADPAISDTLRTICEFHGYGNVIATASRLWRDKNPLGSFAHGMCYGTVEKQLREAKKALAAIEAFNRQPSASSLSGEELRIEDVEALLEAYDFATAKNLPLRAIGPNIKIVRELLQNGLHPSAKPGGETVTAQEFAKAIDEVRLCISSTRRGGNGLRNANDLYEALGRAGIRLVRE